MGSGVKYWSTLNMLNIKPVISELTLYKERYR